jgi:hypothetical protein
MVNVSPLNRLSRPTLRTFLGFTFLSDNPVVHTTITNFLAFPRLMVSTTRHNSVLRCLMAWLKSSLIAVISKLLNPSRFVALARTKLSSTRLNSARIGRELFATFFTINFNHKLILAQTAAKDNRKENK